MPPKTSKELREQAEKQNQENPPDEDDKSRTAEGLEVPTPPRDEFFSNLEKASRSKP